MMDEEISEFEKNLIENHPEIVEQIESGVRFDRNGNKVDLVEVDLDELP
jgi:hypothetical protein